MSVLESLLLAVLVGLALAQTIAAHLLPALQRHWDSALWLISLP